MLGDLVSGLLGGLLGARLSSTWSDRSASRLQLRGCVECALRVVSGEHVGLSRRWRHGLANLDDGRLDFDGIEVEVVSIDQSLVCDRLVVGRPGPSIPHSRSWR